MYVPDIEFSTHITMSGFVNQPYEAEIKDANIALKSLILSHDNKLPIKQLQEEYMKQTGEEIPYLRCGYNSLFHMLKDIPDIQCVRTETGIAVLRVLTNKKTAHLHELIKKQEPCTGPTKSTPSVQDNKNHRHQLLDGSRNISSSSDESAENWRKPVIHIQCDFEDRMTLCTEPVIGSSQLIGDDYFLQLAIRYSDQKLYRRDPKSPITCGTVQSGLTINEASRRLEKFQIMSNKIVLNVGMVDIYNRRSSVEMQEDYKGLLSLLSKKFGYSSNQITLCTLPPNISMFSSGEQYFTHATFNSWLRDLAAAEKHNLIDFHREFTDSNMVIDYSLFQQDARMVSGTIHPHTLFNFHGRQKAIQLLNAS